MLIGQVTPETHILYTLNEDFAQIAKQSRLRQFINVCGSDSKSTCKSMVLGARYAMECVNDMIPFDLAGNKRGVSTMLSTNFTYSEDQRYQVKQLH
jgi:hypothetical protein